MKFPLWHLIRAGMSQSKSNLTSGNGISFLMDVIYCQTAPREAKTPLLCSLLVSQSKLNRGRGNRLEQIFPPGMKLRKASTNQRIPWNSRSNNFHFLREFVKQERGQKAAEVLSVLFSTQNMRSSPGCCQGSQKPGCGGGTGVPHSWEKQGSRDSLAVMERRVQASQERHH